MAAWPPAADGRASGPPAPSPPPARHRRGRRRRVAAPSAGARPATSSRSSAPRCSSTTRPTLRSRCREAVEAFGDGAAYAAKAFLCRAMARPRPRGGHAPRRRHRRRAARRPRGRRPRRPARVARQQQVDRRAGAGPRRRASGASSSTRPTSSTASRRSSRGGRHAPSVLLRGHARRRGPHPRVRAQTGQIDSKFGFGASPPADGRPRPGRAPAVAVDLVGVHVHIGSQVFVADFFHQAVEIVAPCVSRPRPARVRRSAAASASPTSTARRRRPSPSGASRCATRCAEAGITATLGAEPGRSIVGRGRRHPLHAWARSRSSPRASAPTSPSTAA